MPIEFGAAALAAPMTDIDEGPGSTGTRPFVFRGEYYVPDMERNSVNEDEVSEEGRYQGTLC